VRYPAKQNDKVHQRFLKSIKKFCYHCMYLRAFVKKEVLGSQLEHFVVQMYQHTFQKIKLFNV